MSALSKSSQKKISVAVENAMQFSAKNSTSAGTTGSSYSKQLISLRNAAGGLSMKANSSDKDEVLIAIDSFEAALQGSVTLSANGSLLGASFGSIKTQEIEGLLAAFDQIRKELGGDSEMPQEISQEVQAKKESSEAASVSSNETKKGVNWTYLLLAIVLLVSILGFWAFVIANEAPLLK